MSAAVLIICPFKLFFRNPAENCSVYSGEKPLGNPSISLPAISLGVLSKLPPGIVPHNPILEFFNDSFNYFFFEFLQEFFLKFLPEFVGSITTISELIIPGIHLGVLGLLFFGNPFRSYTLEITLRIHPEGLQEFLSETSIFQEYLRLCLHELSCNSSAAVFQESLNQFLRQSFLAIYFQLFLWGYHHEIIWESLQLLVISSAISLRSFSGISAAVSLEIRPLFRSFNFF